MGRAEQAGRNLGSVAVNTTLLILTVAAAVCGVIGGVIESPRLLGVGVLLVAVVLLMPAVA